MFEPSVLKRSLRGTTYGVPPHLWRNYPDLFIGGCTHFLNSFDGATGEFGAENYEILQTSNKLREVS